MPEYNDTKFLRDVKKDINDRYEAKMGLIKPKNTRPILEEEYGDMVKDYSKIEVYIEAFEYLKKNIENSDRFKSTKKLYSKCELIRKVLESISDDIDVLKKNFSELNVKKLNDSLIELEKLVGNGSEIKLAKIAVERTLEKMSIDKDLFGDVDYLVRYFRIMYDPNIIATTEQIEKFLKELKQTLKSSFGGLNLNNKVDDTVLSAMAKTYSADACKKLTDENLQTQLKGSFEVYLGD